MGIWRFFSHPDHESHSKTINGMIEATLAAIKNASNKPSVSIIQNIHDLKTYLNTLSTLRPAPLIDATWADHHFSASDRGQSVIDGAKQKQKNINDHHARTLKEAFSALKEIQKAMTHAQNKRIDVFLPDCFHLTILEKFLLF